MNRPRVVSTRLPGAAALTRCSDVAVNLSARATMETEQKSIPAPTNSSSQLPWLWQSLQVVGVWITSLCWIQGAASGTQQRFLFPKGQSIGKPSRFPPGTPLYFWNYAIIGFWMSLMGASQRSLSTYSIAEPVVLQRKVRVQLRQKCRSTTCPSCNRKLLIRK